MKTARRIDPVAVARSLRELEKLFGKKPPATKENTLREQGACDTRKPIRGGTRNGR